MSTYESDPAGLGTGKRYGKLNVGGVAGTYRGEGSQREIIYELAAGEIVNGAPFTIPVPANYLVEAVYLEVEEAFAATSGANFSIDGGDPLTTELPLSSAIALTSVALTGLTKLSGVAAGNIVLTGDAASIASATGKARVVIQYKAV